MKTEIDLNARSNFSHTERFVVQLKYQDRWIDTPWGSRYAEIAKSKAMSMYPHEETRVVPRLKQDLNSPGTNNQQPNKTMQFDKSQVKKVQSMKGRKPSKWDALVDIIVDPGDTYYFDESVVNKSQAAQAASRLRDLTGKPYHSGYDVKERKTFVRLRTMEEVLDPADDGGDEEE